MKIREKIKHTLGYLKKHYLLVLMLVITGILVSFFESFSVAIVFPVLQGVTGATGLSVPFPINTVAGLFAGLPRAAVEFALGDEVVANLPPFETLNDSWLAANLRNFIAGFSSKARRIIEKFKFDEEIEKLDEANRLFEVIRQVAAVDLHPAKIPNIAMGYLFEDLVRRFNEQAGTAFLIVTHDPRLARRCDRILHLTEEGLQPYPD